MVPVGRRSTQPSGPVDAVVVAVVASTVRWADL